MSVAAEIIEAHDLAFTALPVDANPFMPQESSDLRHYLCTLSGDTVPRFEFYVSLGADIEGDLPDAQTALSLILQDVKSFRDCEGYADFARILGIDEDDNSAAAAWDELSRLAPLVDTLSAPSPKAASVP